MDIRQEKLRQKILGRKRTFKIALTNSIHLKQDFNVFLDFVIHNQIVIFYDTESHTFLRTRTKRTLSHNAHTTSQQREKSMRTALIHEGSIIQKFIFKTGCKNKVQLHQALGRVKT